MYDCAVVSTQCSNVRKSDEFCLRLVAKSMHATLYRKHLAPDRFLHYGAGRRPPAAARVKLD